MGYQNNFLQHLSPVASWEMGSTSGQCLAPTTSTRVLWAYSLCGLEPGETGNFSLLLPSDKITRFGAQRRGCCRGVR